MITDDDRFPSQLPSFDRDQPLDVLHRAFWVHIEHELRARCVLHNGVDKVFKEIRQLSATPHSVADNDASGLVLLEVLDELGDAALGSGEEALQVVSCFSYELPALYDAGTDRLGVVTGVFNFGMTGREAAQALARDTADDQYRRTQLRR